MKAKALVRVLAGVAFALAAAASASPQAAEEPRSAGTDVAVPKRSKFVQPEYPAAASTNAHVLALDLMATV